MVALVWMEEASCPGSPKSQVAGTAIKAWFHLFITWDGFVSILYLRKKFWLLMHYMSLEPHKMDKHG